GKPGGLFAQRPDGTFELINKSAWDADSIYEDHGALFFDADLDGDPDLLVLSGGYESVSPEAWKHRLYINEKNKGFLPAHSALPKLNDVCLRAVALDFDGDRDLDLFLGGRVKPGRYPTNPESYILRNDGNKFVDVTKEVSPDFGNIGMVSDLEVGNIDSDPENELIVVGEWMPITVFNIANGKIEKADLEALGLGGSNGFWNCVSLADMNADGRLDIIAGNIGLNTQYRASNTHPIQCFVSDIDKNGSLDPIITYFEGDISYPVVQKDVLIKQTPVMKKRYLYAKNYGTATIEEILGKEKLKESTILRCYMVESGWWENQSGKFLFHKFPNQAQVSPVQGMVIQDLDGDGLIDILVAGNKYNMEVETGRLDAGTGAFFKGNGKGEFGWINNLVTGIWADRDVRDLALLHGPNHKTRILITNNNAQAQLYEFNK
ncbi:MAG TPA: VCBS repeat-containing protein, partial [Saprospiraceae bacterium]